MRVEPTSPSPLVPHRGARAPLDPSRVGVSEGVEFATIDIWAIINVLLRRKLMISLFCLAALTGVLLWSMQATPLYRATTTLEVQREAARILEGTGVEPAAVADDTHMETQYTLLQSRNLAERVAEKLNLPSNPAYADQTLPRRERLEMATSAVMRERSVGIIGRSRVLQISFISPDAEDAARVANALASEFIRSTLDRKYEATAYARRFIDERLVVAKAQLETSERRLVAYAEEQGILDLSSAGGSEIGSSLDADALQTLNAELAAAQSRRIDALVRLDQAQNPVLRTALSNELIDELSGERAQLQTTYAEKRQTLKPDFPEMLQLQSQIDEIGNQISVARDLIVEGYRAEYQAALGTERLLSEQIEVLKGDLLGLRDRSIQYNILSRDVDTNRAQYEALLQRQKEVSIEDSLGASQVTIVDQATAPNNPFAPNMVQLLAMAGIFSLVSGVGLAFFLEFIDDTIRQPEDVRDKLGLPMVGVVPFTDEQDVVSELVDDTRSPVAESMSSLRTALAFAGPDGTPKSLAITSVRPAEGKTSTTACLGISFARIGRRVLIIDADMRKPSFFVKPGTSVGLSGLLTNGGSVLQAAVPGSVPGLSLIPCGTMPPNPSELLANDRLTQIIREAEESFDLVLIDGPPILGFADAPLLSAAADSTLLIVQAGGVRRKPLLRSIDRLVGANAAIAGVVLSKYEAKSNGYGYSYEAYYHYEASNENEGVAQRSRGRIDLFDEPELAPLKHVHQSSDDRERESYW